MWMERNIIKFSLNVEDATEKVSQLVIAMELISDTRICFDEQRCFLNIAGSLKKHTYLCDNIINVFNQIFVDISSAGLYKLIFV
jgi:hypothetical protein